MKKLFKKQIGVEESLWWVCSTEKKGDLTHFEGDVFWEENLAEVYYQEILSKNSEIHAEEI